MARPPYLTALLMGTLRKAIADAFLEEIAKICGEFEKLRIVGASGD